IQYLWEHQDLIGGFDSLNNLVFGLTADLDFKQLSARVPLGFLASYRAQVPLASSLRTIFDVEGGLYYTGKDALVLGVVVRGRWFDLLPTYDTTAVIVTTVMRYYWN